MKRKIIFFLLLITLKLSFAVSFEFVGNWPFSQANTMAFDEARKHIYLASGGGVYILGVTNPSKIVKISDAIRTRGIIESVLFKYPYLYLGGTGIGLEEWRVDNLKMPELVEKLDTLPVIKSIVFYENHLFLSSNDSIFVISIDKNGQMDIIGRYTAGNVVRGLSLYRSCLFYQSDSNIQIWDIKNPKQLLPMRSITIGRTHGFTLRKDTLYLITEDPPYTQDFYLKIYSLNEFLNLKEKSSTAIPYGFMTFLKGDQLFSIFRGPTLIKISDTLGVKHNLSNFFWDKFRNWWSTSGSPKNIPVEIKTSYVYDNFLYLLTQSQGLLIWNLSDIKEPKFLSYFLIPGLPKSFATYKSNALFVFPDEGMRVFDISAPCSIKEIFYYPSAGSGIKIWRKYVYTGNEIFDISNIKNPIVIGYFPGGVNYFELNYPFLYGTCNNRFLVLDISEPKLVVETGSFSKLICYNRFVINYPYAFILSNNEIRILDISDSTFPFEISKYKGVEAGDSRIILADSILCVYKGDKIYLFSLFNPPELENFYIFDTLPWINSVAIDNNYLYVVTGLSNLKVFQIILPDSIEYLGEYPLDLKPTDEIFIKFPYIFLPTAEAGIQIIKFNP